MPAGINMRFMRHVPRGQKLVQLARTGVKAVIILVATIKINLQALQVRRSRKNKWRIFFPEAFIQRRAKRIPQKRAQAGVRRSVRKLFQQRRHMRRH